MRDFVWWRGFRLPLVAALRRVLQRRATLVRPLSIGPSVASLRPRVSARVRSPCCQPTLMTGWRGLTHTADSATPVSTGFRRRLTVVRFT
jgi:hypothetical protein